MNRSRKGYIAKGLVLLASVTIFYFYFINRNIFQKLSEPGSTHNWPELVHISSGSEGKQIIIVWSTRYPTKHAPKVEYGLADSKITAFAKGVTHWLNDDRKRWRFREYIHRVSLENLLPKKKYQYKVYSDDVTSKKFYFTTWPEDPEPVDILVYGDMGTRSNLVKHLLPEVSINQYAAVFHNGDIAYSMDEYGDEFFSMIESVASTIPYMTCPGNHENMLKFLHYRTRFSMPDVLWPMPLNHLWFSFDLGHAHFVFYSTEVMYDHPDDAQAQVTWLGMDLKRANQNREKRPWLIAVGHRPMYCSDYIEQGGTCTDIQKPVKDQLEEIFFLAGVDLFLNGHEHSYERSWPMYKGKVISKSYTNPLGPVQLTLGSAAIAYGQDYYNDSQPIPAWSAYRHSENNSEAFGRLKIINRTHIQWQVYDPINKKEIDQIWLQQDKHGPHIR